MEALRHVSCQNCDGRNELAMHITDGRMCFTFAVGIYIIALPANRHPALKSTSQLWSDIFDATAPSSGFPVLYSAQHDEACISVQRSVHSSGMRTHLLLKSGHILPNNNTILHPCPEAKPYPAQTLCKPRLGFCTIIHILP